MGWKAYSTAPKKGAFLVYMPEEPEGREIQVMTRFIANGKTINITGAYFSYDLTDPTEWCVIPKRNDDV